MDSVGVEAIHNEIALPVLSEELFGRFSEFVKTKVGIKMPPSKRTMLEARLRKRLRKLKIGSFEDYYEYVFGGHGKENELTNFIDVVTTNKTDFFREPKHFEYLTEHALPDLLKNRRVGTHRRLMVWSAACSTGEEPYTLAMVLSKFAERMQGFRYSILATDISTRVLGEAVAGIYSEEESAPIPLESRKKYLLRGRGESEGMVRITPELRSMVQFGHLNLMSEFRLHDTMDIIFCRNVFIYFTNADQEAITNRFCRYLNDGGYLFVGHAETVNGMRVPLVQVAPTVYRKRETGDVKREGR